MLVKTVKIATENKLINSSSNSDVVNQIRAVKFFTRNLHELINDANSLFGWYMVTLVFYTLVDSLDLLNTLIRGNWDLESGILEILVVLVSLNN